jgi:hypothetical protein
MHAVNSGHHPAAKVSWLESLRADDVWLLQGSCLIGQAARLPLVADAADQQVR